MAQRLRVCTTLLRILSLVPCSSWPLAPKAPGDLMSSSGLSSCTHMHDVHSHSVQARVTIAVMNYHDQSNMERKWLISVYTSVYHP